MRKIWRWLFGAETAAQSQAAAYWVYNVFFIITVVVIVFAYFRETEKNKIEVTLRYIDRLIDNEYTESLWDLQEFTICFEQLKKRHISYMPSKSVVQHAGEAELGLARDWWKLIENDDVKDDMGKTRRLERQLMVVYGRLEALASCAKQALCDFNRIDAMMESFDYFTVLSVSNYLLLSDKTSREWNANIGNFKTLIGRIEEYTQRNYPLNDQKRKELWAGRSACRAYQMNPPNASHVDDTE